MDECTMAGWAFAWFCKPPSLPEHKIAVLTAGRFNDEPPVVLLDRLFDMSQVVVDILLCDPRIDRYLPCREGLFLKERRNKMADRFVPLNGRLGFSQSFFHGFFSYELSQSQRYLRYPVRLI
jgi:hypothetical protein